MTAKGKPIPFEIGSSVRILIGPFNGHVGTVIGDYDGFPRNWVKVRCDANPSNLMFDWDELEKFQKETERGDA